MKESPDQILNTFETLDNDVINELSTNRTYEMALNMVRKSGGKKKFGLANEGSTERILTLPSEVIGNVYVEDRNWYIFLFKNADIGYFDMEEENYVRIGSLNGLRNDTNDKCTGLPTGLNIGCDFDFSKCEWVNIEYNYWNQCNELHIAFSNNCEFYTVNIDEFLDPKRKAQITCSDIKTFKCDCLPVLGAIGLDGGGAGLPNGKYSFVGRLYDKDGHRTNFFNISKSISVGGGKNKPGEISDQYVRLYVEGLNCRYSILEIAVIKKVGGTVNAKLVEKISFNSNGVSYEYRGDNGREIPVPLEEITTRKVNYLQGRGIKIHDGRAFYYQIRNTKNLNTQLYTNSMGITLPIYRVPSKEAHKYEGLQPLERYIIGAVPQYCDGTQGAVGVIGPNGLKSRSNVVGGSGGDNFDENPPFQGNPGGKPASSGGGGVATGGGNGSVTFNSEGTDEYKAYKDLPKDHSRVVTDEYYDSSGNDYIKKHIEENKALEQDLKDGPKGEGCAECGNDAVTNLVETAIEGVDGSGNDGTTPCPNIGNKVVLPDYLYAQYLGANSNTVNLYVPQSLYDSMKADCQGGTTAGKKNISDQMDEHTKELENESVYVPKKVDVTITNSKTPVTGGEAAYKTDGTFKDQYDALHIYKVTEISPNWVASKQLYPTTKNCSGGYIYGSKAGTPVMLMEVPPIQFFESNVVGVKSSKSYGVDETEGYVYMVGLRVNGLPGVLPVEVTGKPMCAAQPWKIVYIPRDALNSRVVASGILINTFSGDANGKRTHAIPRHGVNSRENLDRHIQAGGDDHNHQGSDGDNTLYTFLSPDCLLGGVPLVANKFVKTYDLRGNGWRHGLYAESKKEVGWVERKVDQRGCRESVNLHSGTFGVKTANILGITYAKGDSVVEAPPGIGVPLLNLNRESSVYLKLSASVGDFKDKSFIADGLEHWGPVYDAQCAYGHLIREMDMQYGSLIGARYADIGLYAKGNEGVVEGLVGDSHAGSFNVRRTSYISNKVGDTTFFPSPRYYPDILRKFGFGDPTEPPEWGDKRDPKNKANGYPNQGIEAAANGSRSGDVYYPGTLKCLVFFFCQSRVNAHYRQRGDDEGEVHARNLGKLHLDSAVPLGGRWEDGWLNRFYREIIREPKFLSILRPAIRIGVIIGLPLFVFLSSVLKVNTIFDVYPAVARGILYFATYITAILVLSPSHINRMMGLKDQLKDSEGGADDEDLRQWEDNFMKYNADYNVDDTIATAYGIPEPFNVCDCDDCSEAIYYRPGNVPSKGVNNLIYYSPRQYQNTEINAFRNVLDGDYGEMQSTASQIQSLFSLHNVLYAISSDGIRQLQYDGDPRYTGVDYLLGNGRALGTPLLINEGIKQGYGGTVDPNAMEVTPYGLTYVDAKGIGINLFGGGKVTDISSDKMWGLMNRALDFCDMGGQCRDQKSTKGVYYTIGYDPDIERLLVTKKDGINGASWTMSYDQEGWISAHSYIPNFYMWNRKTLYSVKDGTIWRHNSQKSKQVLYGKYEPSTIWFSSASPRVLQEHMAETQFLDIEIHTVANAIGGGMNKDVTFNVGAWNTSYQFTGQLLLDSSYYKSNVRKDIRDKRFIAEMIRPGRKGVWRLNKINDWIKNADSSILKAPDCGILPAYEDNATINGSDGKGSVMEDYYLRHMLSFEDPKMTNIELILIRVMINGEKKSE